MEDALVIWRFTTSSHKEAKLIKDLATNPDVGLNGIEFDTVKNEWVFEFDNPNYINYLNLIK